MPDGFRAAKTPTRRQLAGRLAQAVPVINAQTDAVRNLHADQAQLDQRVTALESAQPPTSRWGRLRWLLGC